MQEPHLLVLGDSGSGKSAVLRTLAQEIMRTRTPAQAQILLVDYRRAHLGEVPEDYLINYVTSASQATPALREIATYLEGRIPGPDVTPEQLRERTWWSGAELFVLVDDYDLVATQQSSPVAALQPLLAQARDVGLHLAVARRSGGASRALYEPVIQSLRDLAMPGLMLSGNPEEGPLLGNQRPILSPPGRGRLVTRDRGVEVVQLAWAEPTRTEGYSVDRRRSRCRGRRSSCSAGRRGCSSARRSAGSRCGRSASPPAYGRSGRCRARRPRGRT